MSSLKLFYDFLSPPSRALYIFLKLRKIPFVACPVALRKSEHLTEEYKKNVNRFQKVPCIHHGHFKLAESVAIVKYLSREFPDNIADHWDPRGSIEQAKLDEFLGWQHLNIKFPVAMYFQKKWLIPLVTGVPADPKSIAACQKLLIKSLDELEDLWLSSGHEYISGDKISLADIFAACDLEQTKLALFDCTEGRPKLKSWIEKVREQCSPYYQEAHVMVERVAASEIKKLNELKAKL